MALHKTRAVVIGRRAFGESDRLVDFYTREYGKVRGIVIGKGATMLKRIGASARTDLERFFGIKVYLDLTVRVRSDWRKDEKALREFGFLLTS